MAYAPWRASAFRAVILFMTAVLLAMWGQPLAQASAAPEPSGCAGMRLEASSVIKPEQMIVVPGTVTASRIVRLPQADQADQA